MRWAGWWAAALLCSAACGGAHPATTGNGGGGGGGDTTPDGGPSGGDPDAGGPAPECASLMPAPPGAAFTFDVATDGTCGASTIDGAGYSVCDVQTPRSREWIEYGPNGIRSGTFGGPTRLFPQRTGFISVYLDAPQMVAVWDPYGTPIINSDLAGKAIALGPAGGGGVIALAVSSGTLEVRKLDEKGFDITGTAISASGTPIGAAEDAIGVVLALTANGSDVSGLWVDLATKAAGKQFTLGTGTAVLARPLLDGGIAVQLDGRWAGVLRPGEATLQPPPSWIGSAADVVPVRAGKAYALVPASGNRVEIVSAQGNSCGSVTFPGVRAVHFGIDGSVVGSTGSQGCTKLVWRNILR